VILLILTKAPLRVSFIGGGTDYENFLKDHSGLVVAAGISKSVYVNILELPPFAREKFRFTYRITESVEKASELVHPSARETLVSLNWVQPLNIATMADVPGSSGLGSSSAFVVALKLALDTLLNLESSPEDLAAFAIEKRVSVSIARFE
jgi:D-glycero-alpha-D-manno-heptose-7-phosphate kinase